MNLDAVLRTHAGRILDDTAAELGQLRLHHYESAGPEFTRTRLESLFELVVAAIEHRDVAAVTAYADAVAEERFASGFDVSEVQHAFNLLESVMWRTVVPLVRPDQLAESVGLIGTVFGIAKDELARRYVSLASQRRVTSLDLSALFSGVNSLAGVSDLDEAETSARAV
ncbi:MAG TPA: hypothetical protein VFL59_01845 [Candidatus Nanopelagicales bacterium]|nr:hypothetical protein [Candidatus Nanopelagicales bacterium]